MLAKDWSYTLPSTLLPSHQSIPELPEYFDSHMQLWLEDLLPEPRSTAQLLAFFHAADVLAVLSYPILRSFLEVIKHLDLSQPSSIYFQNHWTRFVDNWVPAWHFLHTKSLS